MKRNMKIIEVSTDKGMIRVESPLVEKGLAVTPFITLDHEQVIGAWSITHVKSGYRVIERRFFSIQDANRALQKLLPLTNWDRAAKYVSNQKRLQTKCRKLINAL